MQCAFAFTGRCIAVTNDTQGSPLENEFTLGIPFADDLIPIKGSCRESLEPLPRVTKGTVGVLWQRWWTNWSLLPDLPSFFVFSCFHAFLRAMFPTESIQFKGKDSQRDFGLTTDSRSFCSTSTTQLLLYSRSCHVDVHDPRHCLLRVCGKFNPARRAFSNRAVGRGLRCTPQASSRQNDITPDEDFKSQPQTFPSSRLSSFYRSSTHTAAWSSCPAAAIVQVRCIAGSNAERLLFLRINPRKATKKGRPSNRRPFSF